MFIVYNAEFKIPLTESISPLSYVLIRNLKNLLPIKVQYNAVL